MGQPRPLILFFRSFQTNIITIITTNICEKMYTVPRFEPITFGTGVSSNNHQTRAPAQDVSRYVTILTNKSGQLGNILKRTLGPQKCLHSLSRSNFSFSLSIPGTSLIEQKSMNEKKSRIENFFFGKRRFLRKRKIVDKRKWGATI